MEEEGGDKLMEERNGKRWHLNREAREKMTSRGDGSLCAQVGTVVTK